MNGYSELTIWLIIVTAGPAVKNRIPTAPCSDSSPNSPMMPV